MALVVFAVCMVSYSGPMVKGALNEGASPISVALLRMLAAALLMLPYEARQCVRRHIPMKLTPAQWGLTALAAAFLAAHYIDVYKRQTFCWLPPDSVPVCCMGPKQRISRS